MNRQTAASSSGQMLRPVRTDAASPSGQTLRPVRTDAAAAEVMTQDLVLGLVFDSDCDIMSVD